MAGKQTTSFKTAHPKGPVDVAQLTGNGQLLKYQMKVCKDFKATARAINQDKYDGMVKVVPFNQSKDIHKPDVTDRISGINKTIQSDPISLQDVNEQTRICGEGESITTKNIAEIKQSKKMAVKDKNDALAKFKKETVRMAARLLPSMPWLPRLSLALRRL